MAKTVRLHDVLRRKRRARAREMARQLRLCAREIEREMSHEDTGYCVVMWNRDEGRAYWDGTDLFGPCPLPDYVAQVLRRRVGMMDAENVIYGYQPDDDA